MDQAIHLHDSLLAFRLRLFEHDALMFLGDERCRALPLHLFVVGRDAGRYARLRQSYCPNLDAGCVPVAVYLQRLFKDLIDLKSTTGSCLQRHYTCCTANL